MLFVDENRLYELPLKHGCLVVNFLLSSLSVAVKGIKKQHLVEIRSMGNPPPAVQLALTSVCLLLGESATDWKTIRGMIVKDDFISQIVNFDTDSLT